MINNYEHNTAHQLRPVKGFDIESYMDFVSPISDSVSNALPGTVLHRIANQAEVNAINATLGANTVSSEDIGRMVTGLSATGMPMFLFSKQNTEDVINNPISNGELTSISMNSYGGFNTAPYGSADAAGTNPSGENIGSNMAILDWSQMASWGASGAAPTMAIRKQVSAYTFFPATCGLELASSEFALKTKGGTNVVYDIDMPLTSPMALPASAVESAAATTEGTAAQQVQGGFLKPGTLYKNNICGIVSQKPAYNENHTVMLRFWSVYMPAMDAATVAEVAADAIATEITDSTTADNQHLQYDSTNGITYSTAP